MRPRTVVPALALLVCLGSCKDDDVAGPVILLHYDYMVQFGANPHSHAPDPKSIQIVVESFLRRGIRLYIDPQHNAILERQVVTIGPVDPNCAGTDAVDIHDLRATYLQVADPGHWHYAVFAHQNTTPDATHAANCPTDPDSGLKPDPSSLGLAEIGGKNFIVSFGWLIDTAQPVLLSTAASIFMHELGHNLGLRHGGDVNTNNKPNYISVMNNPGYAVNGIPLADSPGSANLSVCTSDCGPGVYCETGAPAAFGIPPYCFRVDYSDRVLPPLNELSIAPGVGGLDETLGVSGSPGDLDLVLYFVPGPAQLFGPSFGPIDWNNSGSAAETHITADVNNDGAFTLLTGFDDWTHVRAFITSPTYRNKAGGSTSGNCGK